MKLEEKVKKLVEELTLEEKASLCSGASMWETKPIERLGIPSICMTDGPHGVRLSEGENLEEGLRAVPATCFPTACGLAATWDTGLLHEVGTALGKESNSLGVHILLGPGVNIKRSPLGGRNFEYYSEDPVLAGDLGAAFVQGVQGQGVGTSVKHFACNNQEYERMNISAEIEERPLREIYLAAFERVVKKGKPWTVMSAYNRVNGIYASEHREFLTEILRGEWGFAGIVISDWTGVEDRVKAAQAGLDLQMPGPASANDQRLIEAVRSGAMAESVLDEIVARYLTVILRAVESKKGAAFDQDAHHALARQAAAASMVLLKNTEGLLPLQPGTFDSLAVIGGMAQDPRFQGGGSSEVTPTRMDSPLEEIKRAVGGKARVSYQAGYPADDQVDSELLNAAVETAKNSDVAIVFAGLPAHMESEGYDRSHMLMPKNHVKLIKAVAAIQPRLVVVLNNGSAIALGDWIDRVPAVLEAWLPGQGGGRAVADILFGEINPSGKLPETLPVCLSDNPSFLNFPGENGRVLYGEGLYVGYRYYDKKRIEPLFPFGYGLSYTTFQYSDIACSRAQMRDTESVEVSCQITNTGTRGGKEIVQLYVQPGQSRLQRPEKELKAFAKVELAPGEAATVSFSLGYRDFAYYDPLREDWVVDTGTYTVLIGSSSRDVRLETDIQIESSQGPLPLTKDSSLGEWWANDRGRTLLLQLLPAEYAELLSPESPGVPAFIMNMPFRKLVFFSGGALTEEMLDRLVAAAQG
ncbi:MAG: glycosyl hydrolase [Firmicutes bacterium]|nr:glycosyl hydrolase [Bacillota bacterium]